MSTIFAIALYRPNEGKEEELKAVLKNHIPTLREENLITERKAYAFQVEDRTIIEIFEWKSSEAIKAAHASEKVMAV
jgi:quinol monooxygenase YgiN